MSLQCVLQEQSGHDKKSFMGYIKVCTILAESGTTAHAVPVHTHVVPALVQPWLTKVVEKLPEDQQAEFKTKAQTSIKFLIGKIKDLQL